MGFNSHENEISYQVTKDRVINRYWACKTNNKEKISFIFMSLCSCCFVANMLLFCLHVYTTNITVVIFMSFVTMLLCRCA